MPKPALPYPLPEPEMRAALAQANNLTLAARWGYSESTVGRWRRQLQVPPQPGGRRKMPLPTPLWQLRKDIARMPLRRVAQRYGVCETTVWRWAQQLQVSRPERRGKRHYA